MRTRSPWTALPTLLLALSAGACVDDPTAPVPVTRDAAVVPAVEEYYAIDLGVLSGHSSRAWAVNASGHVVGYADQADYRLTRAFLWTPEGGFESLGTLSGHWYDRSFAWDINDAGVVVGSSGGYASQEAGFSWTRAGGFVRLGTLPGTWVSYPAAINNRGEIIGRTSGLTSGTPPFLYRPGAGMVAITAPEAVSTLSLADINDSTWIVGSFRPASAPTVDHAFLLRYPGEMEVVGTGMSFYAINNAGRVVGTRSGRAIVWTEADGVRDLPLPAGAVSSSAGGIDQQGRISGSAVLEAGGWPSAVLWTPDGAGGYGVTVLDSRPYSAAADIANGRVVGWGSVHPYDRATLWAPGPLPLPAAPTGLQAAVVPGGMVDLKWGDASNTESSFRVHRASRQPGGEFGEWQMIRSRPANDTAYRDSTAAPGETRRYRVDACNATGCTPSAPVDLLVPLPPLAPTGMTAAALGGRVRVAWTDASVNETAYQVRRGVRRADGTFTPYDLIASLPAGAAAYGDSLVTIGVTYRYQVASCNETACTAAPAVTLTPPPLLPPHSVRAVAIAAAIAEVRWAHAGDAADFRVRRSTRQPDGRFAAYQTVATGLTGRVYTDPAATAGGVHSYVVQACFAGSCLAAPATAVEMPPLPAAPSGLAGRVVSAHRIDLTWIDESSNESEFRVRRGTRAPDGSYSPFAVVGTVRAGTPTRYADSTVAGGGAYRYDVQACNAAGCVSSGVEAVAVPAPPAAPTGVTARVGGAMRVDVRWTDASATETSFRVARSRRGADGRFAPFVVVGTVAAEVTALADPTVAPGATYRYRVEACRGASCAASASAAVTVPGP